MERNRNEMKVIYGSNGMTLGERRETGTYEVPAVLGMGGGTVSAHQRTLQTTWEMNMDTLCQIIKQVNKMRRSCPRQYRLMA